METRVGLGDKKERTREDEERSFAPQKQIRTAGLPFLSSCTSGDGGSVPTSTPSFSSGPTLFPNDDYHGGSRALQPFSTPFKSPGVGMGVGGCDVRGFPFTSAQWQELQRQALIYKHIKSSVPVPPDLFFSNSPPRHLLPNRVAGRGGGGGTFNLRFSNNMDPEPWRCRRTDGKKWRCSRNAAPDQKYCERHLHRGRPRSRKPVEVSNTKRASTNAPPTTAVSSPTIVTTTTTTTTGLSKPLPSQSSGIFLKDELKIPFQSLEPNKEPRCLDWMKGNNEEMDSSLQWELMHSKIGLKHGTFPVLQYYENQLTLNYSAFLNPDLCSLEGNAVGNHGEAARSFIDAWSTETLAATAEVGNSTSVPTTGELPLSTLTLSMSSTGEGIDHQIQMAPVSPLGGPLGEVLQASSATSTPRQGFGANGGDSSTGGLINILSHGFHGSHEVSPQESPTRLASSPSGVLQKALVSLSDSSNSSSPTFVAASRSEIALQWINQTKQ